MVLGDPFQRWRTMLAKDSIAAGDVEQPCHPWPARTSPTLQVYVPCDGQKFGFTVKCKTYTNQTSIFTLKIMS